MTLLILTALALPLPASADAAEARPTCASYVGTIIQPITIDTAILQLGKVPKIKGEYETAAQFAAREAAASKAGPLLIAAPVDLHHIRYDADAQRLNVSIVNRRPKRTPYWSGPLASDRIRLRI